ncbi:myo-inositol 2-dehydrogenase/D-chiro-inositol 1-dehydrogenase [Paenarthrobacter nicotinovorans]|uniref:Gfo/Idh/MocA family oxidoreductase n=1 Tax=Paenarthrobacter nicotinovorans TaxID=29320 RepID=UPI002785A060|nr:Gfo/Idh/MocA family oxidoreductase [Paenarthrobacter nicotinovorans]MDP9936420.1 myo-inositol 2-dehydrogenase/D-chiro-inositol 1-dehydrogenase [Paenarthrobacter nicotinovorans]
MTYLQYPAAEDRPVRIAVIGAGWIGRFHAESIARRVPHARLEAIVDPVLAAVQELATSLGITKISTDVADVLADPDVDAVLIASPLRFHAELITAAAQAGKDVFCEKPGGRTIAELDAAIDAAASAGVVLRFGFNRRYSADFAAARKLIDDGAVGTPQLLRSLTRDPGTEAGLSNPERIAPGTIFLETLIHDFDTLNWLNPGAVPVKVHAVADALVAPEAKAGGLLDTAVVTVTYSNGAIAVAEANFNALYGYDVRGEVFGSAGMVTAGTPQATNATSYTAAGITSGTSRLNIHLFHDAYTAELAHFADDVAARRGFGSTTAGASPTAAPGGVDARNALAVALAAFRSAETGLPVEVADIAELRAAEGAVQLQGVQA